MLQVLNLGLLQYLHTDNISQVLITFCYHIVMTKNPVANALLAMLYIVIVSFVLYSGTVLKFGSNSALAPIALISLFTFSAATMGYLFLYQPFVLYFDGKKKLALNLFFQTLMTFGGITGVILLYLFFTSVHYPNFI